MPQFLNLPVTQAIVAITAVALAVVRLLTASRPFWSLTPAWLQKLLPAALMAIAALPTAIEHARNWLDIVVAFVVTGAMWFTASRGDKRPPEDKGGTPRAERVNSDPLPAANDVDPGPDDAAIRRWVLPAWCLPLAFGVFALLPGCGLLGGKPPCDESKLEAIDAAYISQMGVLCLPKYDRKEDCPDYPRLKTEHRQRLADECGTVQQ